MNLKAQSPSQTAAAELAAAQAQQAAAQAQQAAAQAQLQQQIQQTTNKIIEQAMRGGKMSADEKAQLKDEIRAAIDAARQSAPQGVPQPPPPPGDFTFGTGNSRNNDIPPEVPQILGIMGFTLVCCVVGFPLARAVARWIDRRGNTPPAPAREVMQRLEAIEQAVESVAVEVERISEGQRFTTRVLSERTHEPAPDFVPAREPIPVGTPANARRS